MNERLVTAPTAVFTFNRVTAECSVLRASKNEGTSDAFQKIKFPSNEAGASVPSCDVEKGDFTASAPRLHGNHHRSTAVAWRAYHILKPAS